MDEDLIRMIVHSYGIDSLLELSGTSPTAAALLLIDHDMIDLDQVLEEEDYGED